MQEEGNAKGVMVVMLELKKSALPPLVCLRTPLRGKKIVCSTAL